MDNRFFTLHNVGYTVTPYMDTLRITAVNSDYLVGDPE